MSATDDIMLAIRERLGPFLSIYLADEITPEMSALSKEIAAILDGEEQRIRAEVEDEVGPGAKP